MMTHLERPRGAFLFVWLLMTGVSFSAGQDANDLVVVDENESDIPLFNLTCQPSDCDCPVNRFEIQGEMSSWFAIGPLQSLASGEYVSLVTLIKAFDYEALPQGTIVEINPVAKCDETEERQLDPQRIQVRDLPDSIPTFMSSTYTVWIPENQPAGSAVVTGIVAIDEDSGDTVSYTVNFSEDQLKLFEANVSSEVIDGSFRRALTISLVSALDYETSTLHRMTAIATDSFNLKGTCEVVIHVTDVQDIPPSFSLPLYTAQVSETAPQGSMVVTVSAYDGDLSDVSNDVTYSITEGPTNLFEIDNTTGIITVSGNLDVDGNQDIPNGQIQMVVEAKEVNTSGQPQVGQSSSTVQVLVLIEDVNDNQPQFNAATFAGSIRQDALMDETVALDGGGVILVIDRDQTPRYNGFTLHLEKEGQPWSVFEPSVKTVFAQASVLIQLKQPDALIGVASSHLEFKIIATETTGNTSADIVVWVESPAPVSEAVVDIPLRTSDFIIFVIGFLIVFNMILTLLLCMLIRRQNSTGTGFFNRNHKYYVSERDAKRSSSRLSSKLTGKDDEGGDSKEVLSRSRSTLPLPRDENETSDVAIVNENTQVKHTVASAVNRSRCDVAPIERQYDVTASNPPMGSNEAARESHGVKGADNSYNSEPICQTALQSTKNAGRCDVTPLKSLPATATSVVREGDIKPIRPQGNGTSNSSSLQCDVIPHETDNTPFSNLLQKVQQKLASVNNQYVSKTDPDTCDLRPITEDDTSLESSFTDASLSNGSSFSHKGKCDVTPLIHSQDARKKDKSKVESKSPDSGNIAHVNLAFSDDPPKTDKETRPELKRPADAADSLPKAAPNPPTTPKTYPNSSSSPSVLPSLSASQAQITQTGVPPIALALPFSTAVIPKEQQPKLTNPVFKEEPVASNKARASFKKDGQPSKSTDFKMTQNQQKAGGVETTEASPQQQNANPLPRQPKAPKLLSDAIISKKESVANGVKPELHQLKNGTVATPSNQNILPHSSQMTKSEPSLTSNPVIPNQDYLTAAKKLLHTASFNKLIPTDSQQQPTDSPSKPPRKTSFKDTDSKSTEKLTQL